MKSRTSLHRPLRPGALLLAALLAAALLVPAGTVAQAADAPVQLEVFTETMLESVNPDVLRGYNFGNWMQVGEFQKQLLKTRPSNFRFPGGDVGDEHDMTEDSVRIFKVNVEAMNRPDVVFHTRVFPSRPTDPPAKNTPADVTATAKMFKGVGLPVRYWEIGNEPDLYSVRRGDKSWTPERYCEVFRGQAQAIREADPQAVVAGPAVSGSVPVRDVFMEGFIRACGDAVDLLTYHIYPTDGSADDATALATAADADEIIARYRRWWNDPQKNPRGHQRRIRFGVTEYGLSWRSNNPNHLADFPGAMWAAEVALRLNRNGVALANYFAFQATGGHGLLDISGVPRPTYYAFLMLADLKGQFVEVRNPDPHLWAHAVLDDHQQLTVLLINKGREARTVSTVLPRLRFAGGDYFDEKIVEEEQANARIKSGVRSVSLPGYSMTRLTFVPR